MSDTATPIEQPPSQGFAPFPVADPAALPVRDEATRWLVDGLWPRDSVGVIGGEAKLGKTWLALELAVAVAGHIPCLGRFDVARAGRVLLFAAEDGLADLRARLEGICRARKLDLEKLDLGVLTVEQMRLDLAEDRGRLAATLAAHRPELLILDPFVRLHRAVDENSATEVSAILGELRTLQRRFHTAIALVHHARKNSAHLRPGVALRGSGDFFAFADVTLWLHPKKEQLWLSILHRTAASPPPFPLSLTDGNSRSNPHLHLQDNSNQQTQAETATDLKKRLLDLLAHTDRPLSQARLRERAKARNASVGQALRSLARQKLVQHSKKGWTLTASQQTRLL